MAGRSTRGVARIGDRDEHVVAVAQRACVVLKQLVVREFLVRDFAFGDSQEDHDGPADRFLIPFEIPF